MGLNAPRFTAKTESSGNRRVLPWLLPGIVVSCFLNLWNLWDNGLGHPYYAASVKSMSGSLHNFFYIAFDPGGFLTVDKPPLSPWLQTVFVMLLGFDGLV